MDKTLAEYFPELVGRIENAERVTLRMMVQHRSVFPILLTLQTIGQILAESSEAALDLILDSPADFEPGRKYKYSNTNYLLISELIEKVVEYSKFQYIKEQILIPLELNNTFGSLSEVDIDDVMSGYYVGFEADLKTDEYGMLATAEDVGIFLRTLNDGSLFDEEEQEIYSSIYEYEHTGWVPGYQSIAKYDKDIDTVIIQFTNTTGGYNWNTSQIVYSRIVKIVRRSRKN